MNDQRKVIYEQRADIMDAETVGDVVDDMRAETVNAIVGEACPPNSYPEQWDVAGMKEQLAEVLNLEPPIDDWLKEEAIDPEIVEERVRDGGRRADRGEGRTSSSRKPGRQVEKSILLQNLDHHWKEHLATLDALRQVVHLRAYAQKTPINEYKQEAFALFQRMLDDDPRGRDARRSRMRSSRCRRRPTCPNCPISSRRTSTRSRARTIRTTSTPGRWG